MAESAIQLPHISANAKGHAVTVATRLDAIRNCLDHS